MNLHGPSLATQSQGENGGTALVTGGSGVMGRALVPLLLEEGRRVRVYGLAPPPVADSRVEFVRGDIRDRERVAAAVRGCDVVFHLAAKLPQARSDEAGFHSVNVGGTVNVADGCVEHGVRRLVFASTAEVYGPRRITKPLDENSPMKFTGPYSRNKFECEGLLARYLREHGLESVSLRIPMVMGPGFYHEKSVLALLWLARNHLPFPISDPEMPLSFVSSEDVARALVLASKSRDAVGRALNIAAPDYPRMGPFFRDFLRATGSRSPVVRIPNGVTASGVRMAKAMSRLTGGKFFTTPSELLDYTLVGGAYSIERARKVLGYDPRHTCLDAWLGLYLWFFGLPAAERADIFFRRRAA